jgi:multifunctional beta-oxidation protein
MANFANAAGDASGSANSGTYEDKEDTEQIKAAKRSPPPAEEFTWSEKDVMLYNLGIGAKAEDLKWVYENADDFAVSFPFTRGFNVC